MSKVTVEVHPLQISIVCACDSIGTKHGTIWKCDYEQKSSIVYNVFFGIQISKIGIFDILTSNFGYVKFPLTF